MLRQTHFSLAEGEKCAGWWQYARSKASIAFRSLSEIEVGGDQWD